MADKHHQQTKPQPEYPVQEKKPSTDVTTSAPTTTGTDLVTYDFGKDAAAGTENIGADEYRLPFLRLLQANSPEVENGTLPGAKAGMLLNKSTGELFDGEKGLVIVPCYRDGGKFIRYTDRDHGGGFVAIYENDDPLVIELRTKHGKFGKLHVPDTYDDLVQTFALYCIALPTEDTPSRVIVSFESTKIGAYNTFIDRYIGPGMKYKAPTGQMVTPPLWAHKWLLRSRKTKNKKGSFFTYELTLAAKNEDGTEKPKEASFIKMNSELYKMGKEFYNLVHTGQVRADYSTAQNDAPVATAEGDEIPF